MISVTDPLGRSTVNTYDNIGNLSKVNLPNGLVINYSYDDANRLTRKTLEGGKYYNYSYDGANYLTGITDQENKSYTWNYDRAGRILTSKDTFGYNQQYKWQIRDYNLLSAGDGIDSVVYSYGNNDQLLSVTAGNGHGTIATYDYDESGRIFQKTYPGSTTSYSKISYNENGWCTTIQDPFFPNKISYNYSYRDDGNISGYTSWAGQDNFTYDANGRLTGWNYTSQSGSQISETYQYDAAGNLLRKGNRTFTYDNANQITNSGITYDNNGNLTSDGTLKYTYDAENKLIQVNRVSDNRLIATYKYNHDGTRKSKTTYNPEVTTNYHWDNFGNIVRESVNNQLMAYYYYDPQGQVVGFRSGNILYRYHHNLRGDIVSVEYKNYGTIAGQYHYDPWGKLISSHGMDQPFRYAGYYYDKETGLYYLKNRYYSPTLGRFLTKDSLKYVNQKVPETINLYAYAYNNPVIFIDPNGNSPMDTIKSVIDFLKGLSSKYHKDPKTGDKYMVIYHNGKEILSIPNPTDHLYLNINLTVAPYLGTTVGVYINKDGTRPYAGYALGMGASISGTLGNNKNLPSEGWNADGAVTLKGRYVVGPKSREIGMGAGAIGSIQVYYVCPE